MNHVMASRLEPLAAYPLTLSFEPFQYDPNVEYFIGGFIKSAGRAVGKAASFVDRAATAVGKIPVIGDIARFGVGAGRLALGSTAIAIDAGLRVSRGQNVGTALRGAVGGQVDAVRDRLRLSEPERDLASISRGSDIWRASLQSRSNFLRHAKPERGGKYAENTAPLRRHLQHKPSLS